MRGSTARGTPLGPALLSAGLLVLAQPPFHLPLLPFLALVPLAVSLGRIRGDELRGSGGLEAARIGLVFGTAHWAILLLWIPLFVAPRFPWAWAGFGVLLGILGGLSALLGWGVHRLHARGGLPLAVAFPLSWVAVEWIKGHVPFGLAWPWMGLGVTLTRWPELLGVAEWVGEPGVSYWLAGVNGLVASALLVRGGRRTGWGGAGGRTAMALGAALLPALVGVLRARFLDLEPGPVVVVVGTQVPRELRTDPAASARAALAQVERALSDLPAGTTDLVVLPEGTVPFPLESGPGASARERLGDLAGAVGAPILVGVLESPREAGEGAPGGGGGEEGPRTNSAVLVTEGGEVVYRYDKVRLVPGMEWGGVQAGSSVAPAHHADVVVGPLVCYESLFEGLARAHRRAGAGILANLSSDIWFGEGARLPGRLFLDQHPAHLILRAVENRVSAARAANGGFSLFIDPLGRVVGEPVPPEGGVARASLPRWPGFTLYSRTGDLVGPAALLFAVLMALRPQGTRRGRVTA